MGLIAKAINWIKNNKFLAVVILIFLYLFVFGGNRRPIPLLENSFKSNSTGGFVGDVAMTGEMMAPSRSAVYEDAAPQPDITDRKVVTTSSLSLLVEDVRKAMDGIQTEVENLGGYIVNTNVNTPEGIERGAITVRVPAEELKGFLATLREESVKVVYENISGRDVTDQYVDIESKLLTLEKNKIRFEQIMDEAKDVDQILKVQQQVFNLQNQIDGLKGQLKYMDATSETSLVTINLSTDEIALPYAPEQPWRPSVVLKLAVRSMIGTVRGIGSKAIWVGVYSVVWIPALIIFVIVRKMYRNFVRKQGVKRDSRNNPLS